MKITRHPTIRNVWIIRSTTWPTYREAWRINGMWLLKSWMTPDSVTWQKTFGRTLKHAISQSPLGPPT